MICTCKNTFSRHRPISRLPITYRVVPHSTAFAQLFDRLCTTVCYTIDGINRSSLPLFFIYNRAKTPRSASLAQWKEEPPTALAAVAMRD